MSFTRIVSSQTVTGEIVSSVTQTILNGGVANSTTINAIGYQRVSSGGEANSTTINSRGAQFVSSGGVANFTNINSGGSQWFFGGTANSTTINSGGDMRFFESGGAATDTIINSGGVMALGGNVSAINIYQQAGGAVYFATGATVINGTNTRTDGHSAFSIVNGVASNFLLEYGGALAVLSGHSAIDTIIESGAAMNIAAGGTATLINQQSWAKMLANTGAKITDGTNARTDGHNLFSIVNGVASNFLLERGGNLTVLSGHSAIDTLIASGGYQGILSGGMASSTTINFGGKQSIASGGVANSTTINSGGTQTIAFGGTATNTVMNNGLQSVLSGGVASQTFLDGGFQSIESGGMAINTDVRGFFGIQSVSSGGIANSTSINVSGGQWVTGTATNTTINDGTQQIGTVGHGDSIIIESGVASNTTINLGGKQYVQAGVADNTIVNSGGNMYVQGGMEDGYTIYTINSSSVVPAVSYSGIASDTIVHSGGNMYVSSGGIARGGLTLDGGHATFEASDNLEVSAMNVKLANAQVNDALLTINTGVVGDISQTTFTLDVSNTGAGNYILGTGADLTGMNNAVFTVTDGGQNVNLQVGSSYTFTGGHKLSLTLTD
ncbi:MAG: AIDA repeat-containing protein, partial [Victivallaceae bacterium]